MRRDRVPTLEQAFIVGLSLALVLAIGTQAWAQGRQTGTLRGSAQDSTDAILPGVTVTARSDALQGARTSVTDLNGNYENRVAAWAIHRLVRLAGLHDR